MDCKLFVIFAEFSTNATIDMIALEFDFAKKQIKEESKNISDSVALLEEKSSK